MSDLLREQKERAVITAVLDLFGVTGSAAFSLPIPQTTPSLYVVVSENREIDALASERRRVGELERMRDQSDFF